MGKIKAAVLESLNKLSIKEIDVPKCHFGEVLIKVEACGICRTDMKCVTLGQKDLVLPRVLGHEIAGRVVETGTGVHAFKQGDLVQVAPGISCGVCSYCRHGLDHLCDEVKILGFNYDGGFAEYILIPEKGVKNGNLSLIPDHVSCKEAAFTEPLACSIKMQNMLHIDTSDTLLLYGAGRLGILNLKLAKSRGIKKAILIENNNQRAEFAGSFDFDYILNSQEVNIHKEIMTITKNQGVSAVISCCPGPQSLSEGLELLAKRGKFGFFSGLIMNKDNYFDLNKIHYNELSVYGSYGCSIKDNKDALDLIISRAVNVSDICTRTISLDKVNKGIDLVKNMKEVSVVIEY